MHPFTSSCAASGLCAYNARWVYMTQYVQQPQKAGLYELSYNPVVSINGLCMSFIFMNYASQLQVLPSHKRLFNSIFIASCITIHEMLERSKAVAVAMCFCCLWNIIFAIGACPYACMYVHPSNLEESYLHYMHAWLPYFL